MIVFGPRSLQGGDVAAETMGSGGEQQTFDEPAVVENLEVVPVCVAGSDDHQRKRCAARGSRATLCQFLLDVVVANHYDFGWLSVARAARPAPDFQDVGNDIIGDGLLCVLTNRPQAS